MRRFFVENGRVSGTEAVITGSEARHIRSVLRMKAGDVIGLFTGTGAEYTGRISSVSANRIVVSLTGGASSLSESSLQITVAQGFLKERKMDVLVRQLTELGVVGWIPFVAERSIPRPGNERLRARVQRWKAIAREAAKQCGRGRIPEIGPMLSFEEVLDKGTGSDLNIIFWERASTPFSLQRLRSGSERPTRALIVFGPEGGFSGQEITRAEECGFETAGLGMRILKADTATISACAIVQYLFGDMTLAPRNPG